MATIRNGAEEVPFAEACGRETLRVVGRRELWSVEFADSTVRWWPLLAEAVP